jgi:hypothetical protein
MAQGQGAIGALKAQAQQASGDATTAQNDLAQLAKAAAAAPATTP